MHYVTFVIWGIIFLTVVKKYQTLNLQVPLFMLFYY